ncbi:MAG: Gldg family protein [Planctomycetes bacterium]|nr:Gldg family protein [Planctomycetota bacterium]
MNLDAICAIWRRQLGSLLLNPLGYVFILVFVAITVGLLFFPDAYFTRNIADLEPLQLYMPWLLVVLLPALAMGSWASERELGTEEHLLTLPMTVGDALLGKWLGVVSFFTLAMAFSLSNVYWVCQLGTPDWGLVLANYAGWWLAGLVFTSLSILASTLVALPAIGFVLGVLFCASAMGFFWYVEWFDPFNRGLVPFGGVVLSAVAGSLGLGLAALLLSSRRWPKTQYATIVARGVIFAAAAITLSNLSVQADRKAVDYDATNEKLSSLSPASVKILGEVKDPVTVVAFISKQLPEDLVLKGKEVENVLKTLEREMGARMKLSLYRPADPLDEAGTLATQQYGFTPRKVVMETAAGRDETEAFLGVVVRSGSRTERIDHFDPGLSVEYEVLRAIRSASTAKKKIAGVVSTDLKLTASFDFSFGQPQQTPEWEFVGELRKQYEIREVSLDTPVDPAIAVLLVPQGSRLSEEQIHRLHDYIWEGRPALLTEDPLPIFPPGPDIASSQGKKPPNPMMGQQQPPAEKGDLQPLLRALGLQMDYNQILWSDYSPSFQFRNDWEHSLVWSNKKMKGIQETDETVGIDALLFPWPGAIRIAPDKSGEIKVTPVVQPVVDSDWGTNAFQEHLMPGMMGRGFSKVKPKSYIKDKGERASIAVEVEGKMKRVYPFEKKDEAKSGEKTDEKTEAKSDAKSEAKSDAKSEAKTDSKTDAKSEEKSGDKKDAEKKDEKKEEPKGLGQLGEKSVHVIVIADSDFAHDQFFQFYRNEQKRFSADALADLQTLRNVQFIANCVDVLAGDKDLVALRARQPRRRPLVAQEEVVKRTQKEKREAETKAKDEAKSMMDAKQKEFDERIKKIDEAKEYDENTKEQLKEQVRETAQRQLDVDIQDISLKQDLQIRDAKIEQQREIEKVRNTIRAGALLTPTLVLAALALGVFVNRLLGESLSIPDSRRRKDE